MTQQRQQQTLTEALAADGISPQQARSKLVEISGLLTEFQQAYSATYQYLCAQGQDATLGDVIQALVNCLGFLS
ncbi:hypothetical protein NIES2111_63520 (plasmid) [Nostoc sp. NIES-2111]|nr:hypothetical protein NIES2111_63520 [Nostoc sp. NIES-2111]